MKFQPPTPLKVPLLSASWRYVTSWNLGAIGPAHLLARDLNAAFAANGISRLATVRAFTDGPTVHAGLFFATHPDGDDPGPYVHPDEWGDIYRRSAADRAAALKANAEMVRAGRGLMRLVEEERAEVAALRRELNATVCLTSGDALPPSPTGAPLSITVNVPERAVSVGGPVLNVDAKTTVAEGAVQVQPQAPPIINNINPPPVTRKEITHRRDANGRIVASTVEGPE